MLASVGGSHGGGETPRAHQRLGDSQKEENQSFSPRQLTNNMQLLNPLHLSTASLQMGGGQHGSCTWSQQAPCKCHLIRHQWVLLTECAPKAYTGNKHCHCLYHLEVRKETGENSDTECCFGSVCSMQPVPSTGGFVRCLPDTICL